MQVVHWYYYWLYPPTRTYAPWMFEGGYKRPIKLHPSWWKVKFRINIHFGQRGLMGLEKWWQCRIRVWIMIIVTFMIRISLKEKKKLLLGRLRLTYRLERLINTCHLWMGTIINMVMVRMLQELLPASVTMEKEQQMGLPPVPNLPWLILEIEMVTCCHRMIRRYSVLDVLKLKSTLRLGGRSSIFILLGREILISSCLRMMNS
mmetsp:Transcript_26483/g.43732  ORF Transcript_26483/g.43732 Transcript_26483/m.43732 type:complete len:204 (+) Transcript_26483:521-1132(+)